MREHQLVFNWKKYRKLFWFIRSKYLLVSAFVDNNLYSTH